MDVHLKQDYISKIESALQTIRPYLQADGGDVTFIDIMNDLTVKVKLTGACETCPMSIQTLKLGVEQTIKRIIPEIKEVVAITD